MGKRRKQEPTVTALRPGGCGMSAEGPSQRLMGCGFGVYPELQSGQSFWPKPTTWGALPCLLLGK